MRTFLSILILLIFSLSFNLSNAQLTPDTDEVFVFDITNEIPQPNEKVYITVRSYSIDLNRSTLTWLVNGKPYEKGLGKNEISLTVGPSGTKTTVEIQAQTGTGVVYAKKLEFNPVEVSLVWEADGYLPPFYKGKAPFTHQGSVRVTAIPSFKDKNGKDVDPKNLIYRWKDNYKVLGNDSGYGKDSIVITGGVIDRPSTIEVIVSDVGKTQTGRAILELETEKPEMVLYENNPYYGVLYNKAVFDKYVMKENEVTLKTVPYYFNSQSVKGEKLEYSWMLNDVLSEELKNAQSITLRRKNEEEGTSLLRITARNMVEIFQGAQTNLQVEFKKKESEDSVTF